MKRKSLIEAVSPEARDFIETDTPKPQFVQAQPEEAEGEGRISDLLKFLVPKVGESFVLDHNVESQEVAQARPRPELAGALETILELAAL
jgi:hypothetical protein